MNDNNDQLIYKHYLPGGLLLLFPPLIKLLNDELTELPICWKIWNGPPGAAVVAPASSPDTV